MKITSFRALLLVMLLAVLALGLTTPGRQAVAQVTAQITGASIADGTITAADLATDSVEAAEIATSAVGTAEVNDNTLTAGDVATSAFTAAYTEYVNLNALRVSTNGTVALTRNAQGDWSLNQTAVGAETTYVSAFVPRMREVACQGLRLDSVVIGYEIAVADATTVDLLVDSVALVQATAPAVAAHGGAVVDGDYDADHDTAAERADKDVTGGEHVLVLTLNTPAYNVTADVMIVVEATFVLANTGTLKVRSFGLTYTDIDEGT